MIGENILGHARITRQTARAILNRVYDQFLLGTLAQEPDEWECREVIAALLSALPTAKAELQDDAFAVPSPMD